jgi:HK97 family phage portal protein
MDLRAAWRGLWGVEHKQSRAGPLFALFGAGQPTPTPRRYDKLAEEGFQKNAIVFRCVNLISECAAAVPWTIFRRRGSSKERLDVHPLLTLLERPNPTHGGASFFKSVYAFRLLSGNSYIESVGPNDGPNAGRPRELWTLRPDHMQVIKGEKGRPAGYQFQAGGRTVAWRVDPVNGKSAILHSKSFHPLDDWYGMSPLEAAAFEVDQHNAAGAWNYALLKNSGRPSGALVYNPGEATRGDVLDGEQFARLQRQIDDLVTGTGNAGRPLILEGGLDWRQISLAPTDLDWLKGRDLSARDIALAYDVPPQLVGIEGSQTFANFEQARLSLYEDAVLPLLDSYRDDFNRWLVPASGEDLALEFNEDGIPALAPRRRAVWDMVQQADFLTVNEKRVTLGFAAIEGGDIFLASRQPGDSTRGMNGTEAARIRSFSDRAPDGGRLPANMSPAPRPNRRNGFKPTGVDT